MRSASSSPKHQRSPKKYFIRGLFQVLKKLTEVQSLYEVQHGLVWRVQDKAHQTFGGFSLRVGLFGTYRAWEMYLSLGAQASDGELAASDVTLHINEVFLVDLFKNQDQASCASCSC